MIRRLIWLTFALTLAAQTPPRPGSTNVNPSTEADGGATFRVTSNLVVIDVAVKEKNGKPIEGLTRSNFVVLEDDKPQELAVFDFQRLSAELSPAAPSSPSPDGQTAAAGGPDRLRNKRLLILFFDYSSMTPLQQVRAVDAGMDFVKNKLTVSDAVAVYAYASELLSLQNFTTDRERLLETLRQLREAGSDLSLPETLQGSDDAEFNLFNTDRKLMALEDVAHDLGRFSEKKALVYISNGGVRTGIENLSQLRATTNAANRANVSFYTVDVRGLEASAPLGNAGAASGKGGGIFSGSAAAMRRAGALSQQDTMFALAADTSGKAMHDSNDLTLGIERAQTETASYYVLGYYSTNTVPDGKFRRVRVQVSPLRGAQLQYRPGYYAAKLFANLEGRERENQLEEALRLENPITDIPIALGTNYFRVEKNRYFVSVALRIPGSAVPFQNKGANGETAFDFIGLVQNQAGQEIGRVRDTIHVKVSADRVDELASRSIQYDAGFTIPPGSYSLKFLVRENQDGKIGTFETPLTIPNLRDRSGLRLSSVVWSGQRETLDRAIGSTNEQLKKQEIDINPLIRNSQKLIPNLTHVFTAGQRLFVYCEAYDLGTSPSVRANVALYKDDQRVFQSAGVRIQKPAENRLETVPIEIGFLLAVPPGEYIAQVNVIDELGQQVAFIRQPLAVLAERGR